MSLAPPTKVGQLQDVLHAKAKESPNYPFYALWANYFCQGPVGKPYRIVTRHAVRRLRRWLCRKHKVETGQAITRYPDKYLNRELGLVRLYCATATFRGRQHESLSESRMRAIRKSGLMSGSVETEHGAASEAPADERAGKQIGCT